MDTKIENLTGITAFLNGQKGLHEYEDKLSKLFITLNKEILILDNLFEDPKKIKQIITCDNLCLSTTGTYADKLKPLIDSFGKLNYAPKAIIFFGENTALYFCEIARELKKKYGTEFFYPATFNSDLFEISWI